MTPPAFVPPAITGPPMAHLPATATVRVPTNGVSFRARLALCTGSVVLALGVAEVAVRGLAPLPTEAVGRFFAPDAELTYRLASGYQGRFTDDSEFDTWVRTNVEGLRGPAVHGDRPGLLGVGDSFLFGYGVEDDETFLALAAGSAFESWNAGAPGYDVSRACRLGVRLLERLRPKAVVLSIFLGNDEADSVPGRIQSEVEEGGLVEPHRERSLIRRFTHAIYVRSHLVRRGLLLQGDRQAVRPILGPFLAPPETEVLAGDRVIGESVRELAAACRRRAATLVLVVIPEKLEVIEGDAARIAARAGWNGMALDLDGPRRRVFEAIGGTGAIVVDARPALRNLVRAGGHPYFPTDRHFTPEGHRAVAALVIRALAKGVPEHLAGSG